MTKEELFKKNFPEYCTEKGVCLSPFYDVFEAGVEIATAELNKGIIQSLIKENAELKENFRICEKNADTYFDNFTKAKEIIQDMLRDIPNRMWYTDATIKEAEQFLKE